MYGNAAIACGVASSNCEFVGYWGYGANQTAVLSRLAPQNAKLTGISGFIFLSAGGFPVRTDKTYTRSPIESDAWVGVAENTLTLGREPFGRMPLFWLKVEEIIWFASKLQLLLPLIAFPEVSIAGLYGYSCFSYVPTPHTPIQGIHTIEAGTELIWKTSDRDRLSSPELKIIWEWEPQTEQITDEKEAIARLQALLGDTIERQIADLPDAPVGVCLSGGLDSSIVAALLVKAGVKVRAYTLDFGERGIPEHPYAQQVAQWLDIPLIKVEATPKKVKSVLRETVKALDLPFGDGVTAPLFLLNRLASQEVGVIFNGEGGDQLFAGWTNKPLIAASLYQSSALEQAYLQTFHRLWGYEAGVFQPEIYEEVKKLPAAKWIESAGK